MLKISNVLINGRRMFEHKIRNKKNENEYLAYMIYELM